MLGLPVWHSVFSLPKHWLQVATTGLMGRILLKHQEIRWGGHPVSTLGRERGMAREPPLPTSSFSMGKSREPSSPLPVWRISTRNRVPDPVDLGVRCLISFSSQIPRAPRGMVRSVRGNNLISNSKHAANKPDSGRSGPWAGARYMVTNGRPPLFKEVVLDGLSGLTTPPPIAAMVIHMALLRAHFLTSGV